MTSDENTVLPFRPIGKGLRIFARTSDGEIGASAALKREAEERGRSLVLVGRIVLLVLS